MSQRLPQPGGDNGDWGDILNAYLSVSLDSIGNLNNNVVGTSQLQTASVTSSQLSLGSVGTDQLQSGSVTNAQLDSPTQSAISLANSSVQTVNGHTPTSGSVTLTASDVSALSESTADSRYIQSTQLGASGGVATLTGTTLTSSQLPSGVESATLAISTNSGGLFGQALSATQLVDLCRPPYNCTPATQLTISTNSTNSATVTSGVAPASGALIAPGIPTGTTFTASGSTLTLSNAATATASGVTAFAGMDCTSARQTAINTATVANAGVDIFASLSGVYLLNGPQQTGTAESYNYSGQLLIPAFPLTGIYPVIRLRGTLTSGLGEQDIAGGGVVWYTSANSGNVIDVIPSGQINGFAFSGVTVLIEDERLTMPANPQCGGYNLIAANSAYLKRWKTSGLGSATYPNTLTGSGCALTMPGQSNGGQGVEDIWIDGWPVSFIPGDHCVMSGDNQFWHCGDGIHLNSAENPVEINVYFGGCMRGIVGNSATIVHGRIGWEPSAGFSSIMIYDPSNYIQGDLTCFFQPLDVDTVPACVFGRNPLLNLRRTNDGRDWMSRHPSDTFTRDSSAATTGAGVPGITDGTMTPWYVRSGTWTITPSGTLKALSSGYIYVPAKNAGESRLINVTCIPQSGSNMLICGAVAEDSYNAIALQIYNGSLTVYAAGANVGTGGSYTNNTSITVGLALYYGPNANGAGQRCYRAKALLNGAVVIDKYIPTADQPAPSTSWPYVLDGLESASDTVTAINSFVVTELKDDDAYLTPQHTVAGTTAGSAIWEMPSEWQSPNFKKVLVELAGYENTTATAQTITFTTQFTVAPRIVCDDSSGATVSTTALTLPASMGSAKTGWIVLEGW